MAPRQSKGNVACEQAASKRTYTSMVEHFTKRTTGARAPGLLAVDGVHGLVQEEAKGPGEVNPVGRARIGGQCVLARQSPAKLGLNPRERVLVNVVREGGLEQGVPFTADVLQSARCW